MNPAYESPALRNYTPSASFISENATHGDMICTPVPENAGRLKGPSLGVLAWFDHVLAVRPRARYIAMADDDAYLHIPELVSILRGIPNRTYAYIGAIMGWSFHDEDYLFRAFGWSGCANCTGPFPFAVGSFMAVSAPLAAALAAGTRLPQLAAANRTELERVYALLPRHHTFFPGMPPRAALGLAKSEKGVRAMSGLSTNPYAWASRAAPDGTEGTRRAREPVRSSCRAGRRWCRTCR